MRNLNVCLLSLILLTGCAQTVSQYLVQNPGVSEEIKAGLKSEEVVKGMTKKEVVFCWGKPGETKLRYENEMLEETWLYCEPKKNTKINYNGSSYWHMDIPEKRVIFKNNIVVEFKVYSDDAAVPETQVDQKQQPKERSKKIVSSRQDRFKHRPLPRIGEVSFSGWPSLALTGVVSNGSKGHAIINKEIVGIGEYISGVKLLAVHKQGAWLEYEGETQFLYKVVVK